MDISSRIVASYFVQQNSMVRISTDLRKSHEWRVILRNLSDALHPNRHASLWRRRLAHQLRFIERPQYPYLDSESQLRSFFPDIDLSSDSVCIDIGANEGWVSAVLGRSGATVISYEPNPWALSRAAKRLKHLPNVHVVPAAVSGKGGLKCLFFPKEYSRAPELHSGSASIIGSNSAVSESEYVRVWSVSMAEVLDQHERIEFLKIDAEGAEAEMWPAIEENVGKIKFLAIETHERLLGEESDDWVASAQQFISRNSLENQWRLDWP